MPARGDGITKRADGRFMGRAVVDTPDGPKRKTVYGKSYEDVRKKLNKLRADADEGLVFEAGSLTVGEYLKRWLADSVRDTVRASTYDAYEHMVRAQISPKLGRIKLSNLTPAPRPRPLPGPAGLRPLPSNRPVRPHHAQQGFGTGRARRSATAQRLCGRQATAATQTGDTAPGPGAGPRPVRGRRG